MVKNPLIRRKEKSYAIPLPNQSAGILDDYAIRKVNEVKESYLDKVYSRGTGTIWNTHILAGTNNTYDIGSTTNKFRAGYFETLAIGTNTITEDLDLGGDINFDQVDEITEAEANAITLTEDTTGGTFMVAGEYHYDFYYVTDEGHTSSIRAVHGDSTVPDITLTVPTATSGVQIDNIPISTDTRVIGRVIMRSTVGNANATLIHTINDNITTSWLDDGTASGSGPSNYKLPNTTAGTIKIETIPYIRMNPYQTFMGYQAGLNSTAYDNIAIGTVALKALTTGSENTAVGANSNSTVTGGSGNTSIGYLSGGYTNGSHNLFIGARTRPNSTGTNVSRTIFLGYYAGYNSAGLNQRENQYMGHQCGRNFGGENNLLIGHETGYIASRIASSNNNILIGYKVGKTFGTGADYNLIIGDSIEPDNTTGSYQMNIGNVIKGDMTADGEWVRLCGDASNYTQFADDGLQTMVGTARVKKIVSITAAGLKAPGSKPATLTSHGSMEVAVWEFADAVEVNQESITFNLGIPPDMDRSIAPSIIIGWDTDDADAGDCEWQLEYLYRGVDEDTGAAAQETLTATGSASTTAHGLNVTEIDSGTIDLPASTDFPMYCRITRLSAHENDTISDPVHLQAIAFSYTSNKLGEAI